MDNSILVHPQKMTGWNEPDWAAFIQAIGIMTVNPDHSWKLLMAVNESFGAFSPECQKAALIAVDRLILQIREDMEQIMAKLQDTYQDANISEDLLEINSYEGGNEDGRKENQGTLGDYSERANETCPETSRSAAPTGGHLS